MVSYSVVLVATISPFSQRSVAFEAPPPKSIPSKYLIFLYNSHTDFNNEGNDNYERGNNKAVYHRSDTGFFHA